MILEKVAVGGYLVSGVLTGGAVFGASAAAPCLFLHLCLNQHIPANQNLRMMSKELNKLISAADSGDLQTVRQLLASGTRVNGKVQEGLTALMAAAGSGHKPLIEALLASGADVNGTDNHGMTPLMMAASRGRVEAVKSLLEAGTDVHIRSRVFPFKDETALMHAAKNGSAKLLPHYSPKVRTQMRRTPTKKRR